jgi:anti-sigma factor RsiW
MSAHLGPAVTALVDGELDHARREEVLAHLTHCGGCRAEVEALRRLKASLRSAAESPQVPPDLALRLLAATSPLRGQGLPVGLPMSPVRRTPTRLRRTAVGGACVALGLGGALSLAGPAPRGPLAPVDPASERFMLDHATTSNEVPFTELDLVSVSSRSSR